MVIVKFPNPILAKVLAPVLEFNAQLHAELDEMFKLMTAKRGIGIAANQVGLDKSMFVMVTKEGERLELVNPEILWLSDDDVLIPEGCLSAPEEFDIIERAAKVRVRYQDRSGLGIEREFSGRDAVCVQHEYDHTQGIFFFSRMKLNRQRRRQLERKWGKL